MNSTMLWSILFHYFLVVEGVLVPGRSCYYDDIDYCDERSICLNALNLFVLSTNFRRTDFVDFAKSWLIFQNGGGQGPNIYKNIYKNKYKIDKNVLSTNFSSPKTG